MLFPNPSLTGKFKISSSSGTIDFSSIELFSLTGEKINCTFNQDTKEIETVLKQGIYIVRLKMDNQWYNKKIVFSY